MSESRSKTRRLLIAIEDFDGNVQILTTDADSITYDFDIKQREDSNQRVGAHADRAYGREDLVFDVRLEAVLRGGGESGSIFEFLATAAFPELVRK